MASPQVCVSEDLLHIYSALRRLGYLKRNGEAQVADSTIDGPLFPQRFLLKLLDERIEDLADFARDICNDLFKQIGGKAKRVDPKQLDKLDATITQNGDIPQEFVRYPEFDEYFHCCVYYLHDFLIDLRWHHADIEPETKVDFEYLSSELKSISPFFRFRKTLVDPVKSPARSLKSIASGTKSSLASIKGQGSPRPRTPRPSLSSPTKSSPGRSSSPTVRRRVRFEELPGDGEEKVSNSGNERRRVLDDKDFDEIHSVLALELLVYAIDIFISKLEDRFNEWSLFVRKKLDLMLDHIVISNTKVRVKQLELVARRLKTFVDVHLTTLDYLNEIETTYLIDKTLEVLCARDSMRTIHSFKQPRIARFIQRCLDIEQSLLTRLIEQFLSTFFDLLICEINFPPVELEATMTRKSREDASRSHENALNFLTGWNKVDDIIFGYSRPRQKKELSLGTKVEEVAGQIVTPKISAKSSTLSTGGAFTSSSRILNQMDNLVEFLRSFMSMSINRLRHKQHTGYFLEFIARGLFEIARVVSDQLHEQLVACQPPREEKATKSVKSGAKMEEVNGNTINFLVIRVRCLKFVHIMSSAEKLVRAETKRADIQIALLDQLSSGLSRFSGSFADTDSSHGPVQQTIKSKKTV